MMETYDILLNQSLKLQLDYQHPIGEIVYFNNPDFDPNEVWGGYGNLQLIGC